jgi:hypothetical protein
VPAGRLAAGFPAEAGNPGHGGHQQHLFEQASSGAVPPPIVSGQQ